VRDFPAMLDSFACRIRAAAALRSWLWAIASFTTRLRPLSENSPNQPLLIFPSLPLDAACHVAGADTSIRSRGESKRSPPQETSAIAVVVTKVTP
jgi:hypothetical protein